jgi:two-component system, cell cycle response regulator
MMGLRKAEVAFFGFMLLLLASGGLLYHVQALMSYDAGQGAAEALARNAYLRGVLLVTLGLLATAILAGFVFVFPLIRTQVREQRELQAMTETLSERSQTLETAALTDPLTGMQNRRYFDSALKEYLAEFRRIDRPVGLMILDLDHFKAINDTHGHDVGDEVLRQVAHCLREFTRFHDVVARIGGEEFAVVAPNMRLEQLTRFADRLRAEIGELTIVTGNCHLKVTASIGLAVWDRRKSAAAFFKDADTKLYEAKRSGRNRVCA